MLEIRRIVAYGCASLLVIDEILTRRFPSTFD